MKYYFLTLFPGLIHQYFGDSMMKRAVDSGVVDYEVIDIRDYSGNKHKKVDDYPYGGGAGMVMAAPPIAAALKSIEGGAHYPVIHLSPGGRTFTQQEGEALSEAEGLIFICGHYEGIDERVIEALADEEISIGDYVLTGGELAALVVELPPLYQNVRPATPQAYFSHPGGYLDINTANAAELELIEGVGPVKAQRIVEYREAHGPFASVEELALVDGISQKTVLAAKEMAVALPPE